MIYNVYRWTVIRDRLEEHDQALAHLAGHIRDEHPLIKGLKSITSPDLLNAAADVVAGRPVAVLRTDPFGCSIVR